MTTERPVLRVGSSDGTRIALFTVRADEPADGVVEPIPTTLVLVHGTGSDHTTWRVTGPLLASRHRVLAMDRRGRGASADGPSWTAGSEVDDVIAACRAVAGRDRRSVVLVGHSFGGRLSVAAAAGGAPVRGVIAIEAAPMAPGEPSRAAHEMLLTDLLGDMARGDPETALARFLRVGAGLPPAELEAFRTTPRWTERVRTAPTITRELDAALHDPALGPDALAAASVPVLQLVGTTSPRWFRDAAAALDARLPAGRLARIDGAGHGVHHSHPDVLAAAIESFLRR